MNVNEPFRSINTFIFDVDGVLTNGEVLIQEDGALLRTMTTRDGFSLQLAVSKGFRVAIITGGRSAGVVERLKNLGITDIYTNASDKLEAFYEFVDLYQIDPAQILYMGDDIPDYEVMRRVGLPACPADAAPEILQLALYVSPFTGGKGCVRDVIEKVLRVQNKWFEEGES